MTLFPYTTLFRSFNRSVEPPRFQVRGRLRGGRRNGAAELQRARGVKVRLTLEVQADAEDGFSEADIGVVRDNLLQLKFKTESTGFE